MGDLLANEEEVVQDGVHGYSDGKAWIRPTDPLLRERLEWFQDQKLGIMMHWGPYSQLGVVESWALSDEDAHWSRSEIDWETDGEELKRQYFGLNRTFNPVRFRPEAWADVAARAGFKYLVFTTKHHDGFCMWDTRTTDYKATGPDCPFHTHNYADICKHVFDAFRAKGLAIAAYFSKPDWHSPYYWAPEYLQPGLSRRGPSYDPAAHPELWEKFVRFTHDQLEELLTQYGRIDALWLDGGWVRQEIHGREGGQDIRLAEAVERARRTQPWLLAVDRTVGGPFENYVTPEQTVPDQPLFVPWESCITITEAFSYRFEDDCKPTRQLVHLLLEVVAKGGNLALNVAPQPDGRLPSRALERLEELGEWMSVHGEGIYGTRICEPYFADDCAFTRKGDVVYGFKLYRDPAPLRTDEVFLPYCDDVASIELLSTN
ncbi:alpha-L-fucosidase [Cohnella sp. GCM10027633]|uniref:alpha-L-fucosidase n=1 Tax=unclassified Cohnella TaxID=2636738 RepID=UPI00362D0F20